MDYVFSCIFYLIAINSGSCLRYATDRSLKNAHTHRTSVDLLVLLKIPIFYLGLLFADKWTCAIAVLDFWSVFICVCLLLLLLSVWNVNGVWKYIYVNWWTRARRHTKIKYTRYHADWHTTYRVADRSRCVKKNSVNTVKWRCAKPTFSAVLCDRAIGRTDQLQKATKKKFSVNLLAKRVTSHFSFRENTNLYKFLQFDRIFLEKKRLLSSLLLALSSIVTVLSFNKKKYQKRERKEVASRR